MLPTNAFDNKDEFKIEIGESQKMNNGLKSFNDFSLW